MVLRLFYKRDQVEVDLYGEWVDFYDVRIYRETSVPMARGWNTALLLWLK